MNEGNWHPKHCPLKAKPRQGKLSTTDFALTQSTIRKTAYKKAGGSSAPHHVSVVNHWTSSLEISSGSWLAAYMQKAALPQHLEYRPTTQPHRHALGPTENSIKTPLPKLLQEPTEHPAWAESVDPSCGHMMLSKWSSRYGFRQLKYNQKQNSRVNAISKTNVTWSL